MFDSERSTRLPYRLRSGLLLIGLLFCGLLRSQSLEDGLVFYAPFDGSPINLVEWNKPTNHGARLVEDKFGRPNRAMAFDGLDDYLDYGDVLNLGQSNFSISLWFKLEDDFAGASSKYAGAVLGKGIRSRSLVHDWGFGLITGQDFDNQADAPQLWSAFRMSNRARYGLRYPLAESSATEHDWHHLVVIRSGMDLQFYLDGKPVENSYANQGVEERAVNLHMDGPFTIGTWLNQHTLDEAGEASDDFFLGNLDELRVYNRRLSARDIEALHRGFLHGPDGDASADVPSTELDIVAYPNPTTSMLYVTFPNAAPRRAFVLDASGRRMRYLQLQNEREEIPVSGLAPGNYFLSVEENGRRIVKQFVKVGAVIP